MTDNEIIKALDVLKGWQKLAYHNDDGTDEDSHELYIALTIIFEYITCQKAEIERLKQDLKITTKNYVEGGKIIKNKAIKECIEKVKEISKYETYCDNRLPAPIITYHITEDKLNNLSKEMMGDDNAYNRG